MGNFEKFNGDLREKCLTESEKDFILAIKSIMKNGKDSQEANGLLSKFIYSIEKFCEDNNIEDKKDFINTIIEDNFSLNLERIVVNEQTGAFIDFEHIDEITKEYQDAKNVIRERAGLNSLEVTIDSLLKEAIKNIPAFEENFYYRTYSCNELLNNMDKIKDPDTSSEEIEKCKDNIEKIIENRKANIALRDDEYILDNNLIFDKLNRDIYYIEITMGKEEFIKNKTKVLRSFITSEVIIDYEAHLDYIDISFTCRNEAEVYSFFRILKEFDIKIQKCLIYKFNTEWKENISHIDPNTVKEFPIGSLLANAHTEDMYIIAEEDGKKVAKLLGSSIALLDEEIIYKLVNNCMLDFDKVLKERQKEKFTSEDNTKREIKSTNKIKTFLQDNLDAFFIDTEYEGKINEYEMTILAHSLYNMLGRNYRNYSIVYTYLLLNYDNENVKRLLLEENKEENLGKLLKDMNMSNENCDILIPEIREELEYLLTFKARLVGFNTCRKLDVLISTIETSFVSFSLVDYIFDQMVYEIR